MFVQAARYMHRHNKDTDRMKFIESEKIESNRQQLTFEQLKIYYEAKGKLLNDKFLENLDLLTSDGKLNYVAYLLADENGASIKVAKYNGIDKYDLIERNEYGYCSLVKATKSVLDKLEVENSTFTKITSKERIEQRLVDPTALREAVINAIVHNDYSKEVTPVFEIFSDRIEITSYGGLVEGLSREDFLSCRSMCRNRELMRVFQDLELVEQLGSGMTRILKKYDESIFKFTDNFLTVVFKFPNVSDFIIRNGFEKDSIKLPENMNKDYKNVGINVGINYTGLEKKILSEIKNNPFISAESMAEKLGKSSRTIERAIGVLKNKNIIRRKGANKNGYWEIVAIQNKK